MSSKNGKTGEKVKQTQRAGALRSASYQKARLRHLLLTSVPSRLSLGALARRHAGQQVVVREVEAMSPLWPREFDGLRIGHVSDLHLGSLMSVEQATAGVELLRRHSPDLVACTGDVVDLDVGDVRPVLDSLANLAPSLGTFLVLGNHDYLDDAEHLAEEAVQAGLCVLRDQSKVVQRGEHGLKIAGIDWAKSERKCASRVAEAGDGAHLLLAHNPKAFAAAVKRNVAMTLSGHTHGGQVAFPGRPRMNLAMSHRHRAGLYESGESRLYVTSGLGAWFPLRLNCPAEVAVITMRRTPTA